MTKGCRTPFTSGCRGSVEQLSEVGTHAVVYNWGKTVMKMETILKINHTFSNVVVKFYKIFRSLPCTQHGTQNDNAKLSD